MKKTLLALFLLVGISAYSHAQTTPVPTTPPKTKAKKPATTSMTPATVHTRKDGGPDKRYKENK